MGLINIKSDIYPKKYIPKQPSSHLLVYQQDLLSQKAIFMHTYLDQTTLKNIFRNNPRVIYQSINRTYYHKKRYLCIRIETKRPQNLFFISQNNTTKVIHITFLTHVRICTCFYIQQIFTILHPREWCKTLNNQTLDQILFVSRFIPSLKIFQWSFESNQHHFQKARGSYLIIQTTGKGIHSLMKQGPTKYKLFFESILFINMAPQYSSTYTLNKADTETSKRDSTSSLFKSLGNNNCQISLFLFRILSSIKKQMYIEYSILISHNTNLYNLQVSQNKNQFTHRQEHYQNKHRQGILQDFHDDKN
eukprot:TRINITY_DN7413_c0_g1_i8.p1 TRINITY_DN7413_c0_g1~~TRINITY_DN7413_c0_g1_i8.p1  ORF type:complete len:305 (+),score=-35.26 TRINITY_DN7413_c0_g1_i8:653-1567(+)